MPPKKLGDFDKISFKFEGLEINIGDWNMNSEPLIIKKDPKQGKETVKDKAV